MRPPCTSVNDSMRLRLPVLEDGEILARQVGDEPAVADRAAITSVVTSVTPARNVGCCAWQLSAAHEQRTRPADTQHVPARTST